MSDPGSREFLIEKFGQEKADFLLARLEAQRRRAQERKTEDWSGRRFDLLVVEERAGETANLEPTWLCLCDCGQRVIVDAESLDCGSVGSCGCRNRHEGAKTVSYEDWRDAVRKRDKHTCQQCGRKAKHGLHAHHIKPWNDCPEGRFDVDNGITLCERCHSEAHVKERR
jgi:HNH endonuclease